MALGPEEVHLRGVAEDEPDAVLEPLAARLQPSAEGELDGKLS